MTEATEIEHVEKLPGTLWERLRAEPDRAPEIISLAAADRFGPQAERWVAVQGPHHQPPALAQLAVRRHVRLSRIEGGALGIGGIVTTAPDLVALLWLQSRMVFFVAGAMGYDPRHPMRPAELLALQGVYETPAAARQSLDGVGQSMAMAMVQSKLSKGRDEQIAAKLMKYAGKRIAKRYAGRLVPFLGAPLGAISNGAATKELGRRTLAFYGAPAS
ncbi:MAG: EcsC family protein [Actinomycetota bacterium]|nr:EcsC family protein [Actinomycetota bacterium]